MSLVMRGMQLISIGQQVQSNGKKELHVSHTGIFVTHDEMLCFVRPYGASCDMGKVYTCYSFTYMSLHMTWFTHLAAWQGFWI